MPHILRAVALAALVYLPDTALARCVGTNLIDTLAEAERSELMAEAEAVPYSEGLLFRATRGADQVTLVGTYHLADPRHDELIEQVTPLLSSAQALLVEAGPSEESALQADILRKPDLSFVLEGPTLPERMEEDAWKALKTAMAARGVPSALAAKTKPWMVAVTLGLSPCQTEELRTGARGLDDALITAATEAGLPMVAVEPYDTVFKMFDGLSPEEELELIAMSMAAEDRVDDFSATVADAYFDRQPWLIWAFGRLVAYETVDLPRAEIDAQLAEMQEAMMDSRNRDWIDDISEQAALGPVVLAVGALHLPGEAGLLRLLEAEGWTVEQLDD